MAKVGMRHRENFNEIVGNLSRDAVRLTHPNRMALLAMNNKIFASGLEDHLEAQQPTQNPTQQVYSRPPPQVAPYVPNAPPSQRPPIEASAAADGPPAWMGLGVTGLSRVANLGGNALGGMISGLVQSGTAVARTVHSSLQAQEAARQAARATAIRDDDFDFHSDAGDFHSIAGASDSMAIEDAQQFHEMRMQNHARDMAEAKARSQRDAIAMVENTHQRNPFDDGGATFRLMNRGTTASAPQIMQFAIEDTRPTFQHDGMDLITPSSSSWMELPIPTSLPPPLLPPPRLLALPPPPVPFSFDSAQAKRARVDSQAIVPYSRPAGPSSAGTNRQLGVRSKMSKAVSKVTPSEPPPGADGGTGRSKRNTSGVAPTPATDRRRYKKIGQVPGRTPEEKLDYLLKQKGYQRVSQPQASRDGMLRLPPSDGTNPFANVFGGRSIGN
jgi:hypothetical protein